jgi:hypothetical protein
MEVYAAGGCADADDRERNAGLWTKLVTAMKSKRDSTLSTMRVNSTSHLKDSTLHIEGRTRRVVRDRLHSLLKATGKVGISETIVLYISGNYFCCVRASLFGS